MSYNIDSTEYIRGQLKIRAGVALELFEEHEEELPEDCFLYDIDWASLTPDALVEIESPSWQGVSSGNSYDLLKEKILPRTEGEAVIMFDWEGGDSYGALHVKDGVVKGKKVRHSVTEGDE